MSGETSHEKGETTEAIINAELKKAGLTVSIPWGRPRYDCIVDTGENLIRVQMKSGRFRNGTVVFQCCSGHINSQGNKKISYTEDEIDAFLVYCDHTEDVYYVPVEEANASEMRLRVDDSKQDHPTINWAEDYLLSSQL